MEKEGWKGDAAVLIAIGVVEGGVVIRTITKAQYSFDLFARFVSLMYICNRIQ
jgi:hypothetical protein